MTEFLYSFKIDNFCSIEIKKVNFPFLIQLLKYCKEVENPTILAINSYRKELIAKNLDWSIKTHASRFSQELHKLRKQDIILVSKKPHSYGSTTYEFNPEFVEIKEIKQEQEQPVQQCSSHTEIKGETQKEVKAIQQCSPQTEPKRETQKEEVSVQQCSSPPSRPFARLLNWTKRKTNSHNL